MTEPVENDLTHPRCPLCGGAVEPLGPLVGPRTTQFSTVTIALRHAPSLAACAACGSRFVQNAVPGPVAASLYQRGDGGARWTVSGTWDRCHAPAVVARVAALAGDGARVLDVGCNTGELLDFARARGARTAGVEYSEASRRRCEAKGHKAFARVEDVTGTYDLITAFDLLEHLYDLPVFLARCAGLLAPGGRLVALTGDIECADARRDGAAWWYVQFPEHVVFPSRRYLSGVEGLSLAQATPTFNGGPEPTGPLAALRAWGRALLRRPLTAPKRIDHVLYELERPR